MAAGAISKIVPSADYTVSNKRLRVRTLVCTSGANYTTGGESVTPAQVGLSRRIEQVNVLSNPANSTTGALGSVGVKYQTDGSVRIQYYFSANGVADTEVAASTDLSTYSFRAQFIGV